MKVIITIPVTGTTLGYWENKYHLDYPVEAEIVHWGIDGDAGDPYTVAICRLSDGRLLSLPLHRLLVINND